jgi:hypothetical protein
MEAPVCRICGKKHWSRVCDGNEDVTKRVTVTASVTPLREADLEAALKQALAEVERLTNEIERLKVVIANEHWKTVPEAERNRIGTVARPEGPGHRTDEPQTVGATASARRPMTSRERVAKHRAKQKQVV